MLLRHTSLACLGILLAGTSTSALAQDTAAERDQRTREYVRILVVEIEQWTKDFPHEFYMAAARAPVDSSKLSERIKASAEQLGDSAKAMQPLSSAPDVLTNSDFKSQVGRTLAAAKSVNEAFGIQKFPPVLQTRWDEIRTDINNLAEIYKLDILAYIPPPASGPKSGASTVAAALPPGGIRGYVVDQSCALKGKGMWTNTACVQKCIRDGDKVVLVTEEGKIYQIANPEKIDADAYGQKVVIIGKTDVETITITSLQL